MRMGKLSAIGIAKGALTEIYPS